MVIAWLLAARAQEPGRIYRVGGLHASPRDGPHHLALFDELRRLGFIDGQNLVVDAAGYGMSAERFAVHAAELVNDRVAALRLPTVYQWPEMAEQGGLIGYGPLIVQLYRDIMSRQLAKLLRGVKPADLPVEQPTRFELVINLRAAHAIGHDVPAGLVLRADKVIE